MWQRFFFSLTLSLSLSFLLSTFQSSHSPYYKCSFLQVFIVLSLWPWEMYFRFSGLSWQVLHLQRLKYDTIRDPLASRAFVSFLCRCRFKTYILYLKRKDERSCRFACLTNRSCFKDNSKEASTCVSIKGLPFLKKIH